MAPPQSRAGNRVDARRGPAGDSQSCVHEGRPSWPSERTQHGHCHLFLQLEQDRGETISDPRASRGSIPSFLHNPSLDPGQLERWWLLPDRLATRHGEGRSRGQSTGWGWTALIGPCRCLSRRVTPDKPLSISAKRGPLEHLPLGVVVRMKRVGSCKGFRTGTDTPSSLNVSYCCHFTGYIPGKSSILGQNENGIIFIIWFFLGEKKDVLAMLAHLPALLE